MSENLNNPELQNNAEPLPAFSPDLQESPSSAPAPVAPPENAPKKWYKTSWGIAIIIVAALVFITVVFFLYNFFKFWWMIRHGQGAELEQKYGQTANQTVDSQMQARRLMIETADSPYFGNKDAQLVIVEFVDYKCPICKAMAPTMFKLAQTYNDKIKLIIRDLPIDSLHPGASDVAKLAYCAHQMGVFWPAYNWLFTNQSDVPDVIDSAFVEKFANEFSLDRDAFSVCFKSSAAATAVNRDFADAYRFAARGTPTYFINGQKAEGNIDFSAWEKLVKQFYGIK